MHIKMSKTTLQAPVICAILNLLGAKKRLGAQGLRAVFLSDPLDGKVKAEDG